MERGFRIKGQIVIKELTEDRDTGRHVGVVWIVGTEDVRIENRLNGIGEIIQRIDRAAFFAELFRLLPGLVGRRGKGRKLGKHAGERLALFLWRHRIFFLAPTGRE